MFLERYLHVPRVLLPENFSFCQLLENILLGSLWRGGEFLYTPVSNPEMHRLWRLLSAGHPIYFSLILHGRYLERSQIQSLYEFNGSSRWFEQANKKQIPF